MAGYSVRPRAWAVGVAVPSGKGRPGVSGRVAVKHQQFLDFIVQGCAVRTGFGTDIQQFQIDFICFQRIGISCRQSFGIHGGQFLGVLQPGVEQFLLMLQHDDVQAHLFGLQQYLLAYGCCLCVQRSGFETVHLSPCYIQCREIETLGNNHFTYGLTAVLGVPKMGVREGGVRQIVLCLVFQLLRGDKLCIGLQFLVVRLYLAKYGVDACIFAPSSLCRRGGRRL